MVKLTNIFEKFLIYKNYKVFLLTFYSILVLIIYLNWDYIFQSWVNGLKIIEGKLNETESIFILMYYWFFSIYAVLFLFWPLHILDKKYDNNQKVSIQIPKTFEENKIKFIKYILLFVAFPILSLLGVLIWIIFSTAFDYLIIILSIFFYIFLAIIILYLIVFSLIKIVRKLF